MLIHHSFGFPNIFLKGGSRDPKDPPWIRPWAIQTLDIIDSCLTTTISCSNVASCTLIVEQQIIGPAFAGLPDLQLRL